MTSRSRGTNVTFKSRDYVPTKMHFNYFSANEFYDISFRRDFHAEVRASGKVLWIFGGNFATSCTLDMTRYPFDEQTCTINIGNWAYTNRTVRLRPKKDKVEKQVRN